MTDALLLQTLARIEEKLDGLTEEVAEMRGARHAIKGVAAFTAGVTSLAISLAGLLVGLLLRRHT